MNTYEVGDDFFVECTIGIKTGRYTTPILYIWDKANESEDCPKVGLFAEMDITFEKAIESFIDPDNCVEYIMGRGIYLNRYTFSIVGDVWDGWSCGIT